MKSKAQDFDHERRITRLETVIESINQTLIDIKTDIKDFKSEMKKEFADIHKDIAECRKESFSHFKWTLGFICVVFGAPAFVPLVTGFLKHFNIT